MVYINSKAEAPASKSYLRLSHESESLENNYQSMNKPLTNFQLTI